MELAKECKKCLYEKEIKRAENIKNLLERKQYIKEVEYALEHLSFDSPPEYIDCFLKIYKNSGQEVQSYKKLKEKYNIKMQQKVKEFEEEINQSENPLKLAIQLAIVGHYIDCLAMPTIDDKVLNRLLMQYREIKLDDKIGSMKHRIIKVYRGQEYGMPPTKEQEKEKDFKAMVLKLDALSPLKTMVRGFSIIEKDGKIIKSCKDLEKDDEVSIKLIDGNKQAKIM